MVTNYSKERPGSKVTKKVYENPCRFILFDNTFIIAPVKGLMEVFREAVEIKKKSSHRKVAINIDTAKTDFSPIYTELINFDRSYGTLYLQSDIQRSQILSVCGPGFVSLGTSR